MSTRDRSSYCNGLHGDVKIDLQATPGGDVACVRFRGLALTLLGLFARGTNGLCKRMVKTKSVDLIGTGPRVQMIGPNKAANEWLENLWVRWSRKSRFARALRTACKAKVRDGEAIGILARNLKLPTPAKFSLRILECERLLDGSRAVLYFPIEATSPACQSGRPRKTRPAPEPFSMVVDRLMQ